MLQYTILGKDEAPALLIPAGEFLMGSNYTYDERPAHTVYLDAFYMDVYEVTVFQYMRFIATTGYPAPDWPRAVKLSPGAHYPIVYVSWNDAVAYCEWAGTRLPTEAEWEKAARGGLVGKKSPWGNSDPDAHGALMANYDFNVGHTTPVGQYPPNGYGLYDMAGNVWEWCADWYDREYYAVSPRENPRGGGSGKYRVLRGGSWYCLHGLRCATRSHSEPESKYHDVGFRCARS